MIPPMSGQILDRLLELWRDTLADETVGADDDVLQLGATSLQMMTVVGQIAEEFDLDVPVEVLFDAVTIADQWRALESAV